MQAIARDASWKLSSILRTQKYFSIGELVGLYKSKILSFIECKTAAVYHACGTHLSLLDRIQRRFLREIGVSEMDALMEFNLAPLSTRRDLAMLGLVHRTVLREGPVQFQNFFRLSEPRTAGYRTRGSSSRHSRQLEEVRGAHFLEIERRSALGLVGVYNLLPEDAVLASSVSVFQSRLQHYVKERAKAGCADWAESLSPRIPLFKHPLR